MMKDSPMQPDKYRDYIYNVSWDLMNTRGQRALDVLSADDRVSKEEAMALAFDVTDGSDVDVGFGAVECGGEVAKGLGWLFEVGV